VKASYQTEQPSLGVAHARLFRVATRVAPLIFQYQAKVTNNVDHPDCDFVPAVNWSAARMAAQPSLGILPKRGTGTGANYRAHSASARLRVAQQCEVMSNEELENASGVFAGCAARRLFTGSG
jgi:hypothetical protein